MNDADKPAADRFCDLVMKGGITSGIVYPKAVARIARHYHLHSIGGTSAGAIAAAVSAAAEYQRRSGGSMDGFVSLARIPDELGKQTGADGNSKLLSLFQPSRANRRLFAVLVSALNRTSTARRMATVVTGIFTAYWPATLTVAALTTAALVLGAGYLLALVLLVVLTLSFFGIWIWRDLTAGIVGNGFGLCRGMPEYGDSEALTPWLHRQIQTAAGRGIDDKPLTFGDLRTAPGAPAARSASAPTALGRSINLQIYATNLSHGRPYVFPLQDPMAGGQSFRPTDRLFFTAADLKPYLPRSVLTWMIDHSSDYECEPDRAERDPDRSVARAAGIRCLPLSDDMPILFAARLSLSFPVLVSAVPLLAINHDLPRGQRGFQRCWFSDGGISSNFPMHLFDGLVPRWPTFGISLEPEIKGRDLLYLPTRYAAGYGERWSPFGSPGSTLTQLGRFVAAIVSSMQNWSDNTLARMPGVRDRVVRVRLQANEGGLNLNMTPRLVLALAARGEEAADLLLARYLAQSDPGAEPNGWDEHRYVRLNTLLQMLESRAPDLLCALDRSLAHARDYRELIAWYAERGCAESPDRPPGHDMPLSPGQAQWLETRLALLEAFCRGAVQSPLDSGFRAIPRPRLTVRPPV